MNPVPAPHRARSRMLVLGAALGYDFDMLARFVASLRRTGYAGDVALLVHDTTPLDERLESFSVERITVREPRPPNDPLRRIPRVVLRKLGLLPLGSKVTRVLPLPQETVRKLDERSALLVHPPGTSRYLHYQRFLGGMEHRYDRILLSDVKDVIFQRDPSIVPVRSDLNFYLESRKYSIGTEPQNASWIRQLYGEDELERMKSLPISCSGTTIGTHDAILRYLDMLVLEMNRVIGRVIDPGFDQGVHNRLIQTGRFDGCAIEENGAAAVLTMGIEDGAPFAATDDGDIYLPPHPVPAIVHQYNWHPAWDAHVRRRFPSIDRAAV